MSGNALTAHHGVENLLSQRALSYPQGHRASYETAVLLRTAGRVWEAACSLAGFGRSVTLWGQRVS